jgi:glutaredoxin
MSEGFSQVVKSVVSPILIPRGFEVTELVSPHIVFRNKDTLIELAVDKSRYKRSIEIYFNKRGCFFSLKAKNLLPEFNFKQDYLYTNKKELTEHLKQISISFIERAYPYLIRLEKYFFVQINRSHYERLSTTVKTRALRASEEYKIEISNPNDGMKKIEQAILLIRGDKDETRRRNFDDNVEAIIDIAALYGEMIRWLSEEAGLHCSWAWNSRDENREHDRYILERDIIDKDPLSDITAFWKYYPEYTRGLYENIKRTMTAMGSDYFKSALPSDTS